MHSVTQVIPLEPTPKVKVASLIEVWPGAAPRTLLMYPSSLDGHPRQPEPRTLLMHPSCTPVSLSGAAVAETPRYKYQPLAK